MTSVRRLLGTLALAVALAGPAGAARAQVPLPADDPFYAVPGGLTDLANGTVLRARPVDVSALSVPLPARAWQLEYKSLDAHDRPTAMVTTVMVPTVAWTGAGARPLVSYQVAEDGADAKCAVSYALRAGAAALPTGSNPSQETGVIGAALLRGWAVVASDYEGPDSAFLAAPEEAHGVLDGIRAALGFAPAGFGANTPVALWGYSGGGYASAVAALFAPAYAPELKLSGAALGGPAVDVKAELEAFSGTIGGGAIAMGMAALDRAYPEAHIPHYLNAAGRAAVSDSAHDCLATAAGRHPGARIEDWQATPTSLQDPDLNAFLRSISPRFMPGHPTIPILHYHARTDEFAPFPPADETMARWCAAGTVIDQHVDPLGEHIAYLAAGAPTAMDWLAARFAGVPAPNTMGCHAPAAAAPVQSSHARRPGAGARSCAGRRVPRRHGAASACARRARVGAQRRRRHRAGPRRG